MLSTEQAIATARQQSEAKPKEWRDGFVPVAQDMDDDYIIIDTADSGEKVYEYSVEDGLGM